MRGTLPLVSFGLLSAVIASASTLIYETNEAGNTVNEYSAAGNLIETLNPAIPFSAPYVLATDAAGDVWVSDNSNGRVVEFDSAGNQIAALSAGLGAPGGLAFDAAGDLYVVDRSDGNILDYSGGSESVIANIPGARGLAYYGGYFYAASSTTGTVIRFAPDGSGEMVVAAPPGGGSLRGVAFDATGDLFISDVFAGDIYEQAAGSSSLTLFASGLDGPEFMAIDASGTLYVPEYYGGTITVISSAGAVEGNLVSGLDAPSSVALVESPEPATAWLAAFSLLFIAGKLSPPPGLRVRRKKYRNPVRTIAGSAIFELP